MSARNKQEQFIDEVITEFSETRRFPRNFTYRKTLKLGTDVESVSDLKGSLELKEVSIWDPLTVYPELPLTCEICGSNGTLHQNRWIDGRNKYKQPRSLCSLTGETLLVSRVYRCTRKHQILSHDSSILSQTREVLTEPFFLTHKSGVTRELYNVSIAHHNAGMSTSEIHTIWQQTLMDNFVDAQQFLLRVLKRSCAGLLALPDYQPKQKQGFDVIRMCSVDNYFKNETLYNRKMSLTTAVNSLACDHTFKVSVNIGFFSNGKWIKVYSSLFVLLNEDGQGLAWKLCKGEKFELIEDVLKRVCQRLKEQGADPKYFFIDNCCQWRSLLKLIFPNLLVKLDLFHGIQRVVKAVPKKKKVDSQMRLLRKQMLSSLRLIFRDPSDQGEIRTFPTPNEQHIVDNIYVNGLMSS